MHERDVDLEPEPGGLGPPQTLGHLFLSNGGALVSVVGVATAAAGWWPFYLLWLHY